MPVLYHELVICRDEPLESLLYCGTPIHSDARDRFFQSVLSGTGREIIDGAVKDYGDWTVLELSRLCCEKGSPWDECYTGEYGVELSDKIVRNYYRSEMVISTR